MRRRLSGLLYLMAVVLVRTWSVGGVVMRTNAVQGDGVKEEGTDHGQGRPTGGGVEQAALGVRFRTVWLTWGPFFVGERLSVVAVT